MFIFQKYTIRCQCHLLTTITTERKKERNIYIVFVKTFAIFFKNYHNFINLIMNGIHFDIQKNNLLKTHKPWMTRSKQKPSTEMGAAREVAHVF